MNEHNHTTAVGGRRPIGTWLTLLLIAEILCAASFVAVQAGPLWRARWVQDDAYVSFRYAKNFVHGDGLVYNVGARVEGYTNFLWTMLSTIPLAAGADDPLPFMHAASLACWVLSYLVLLGLEVALFRQGSRIAPLALIPLTYHWSFNMWFFSGMETPLVSLLMIAALACFTLDPQRHRFALFGTSLAVVGLTMTRPDGVVTLAALTLAGLGLYWRPLFREKQFGRYFLLPALPILSIYIPYNIWRVYYYGSLYPNTYYAKVAYLTYYTRGWEYLRAYFTFYRFAPYLPLAVIGGVLAPPGGVRRYLWGALATAALVFFYVVRVGGDFMEWRFVTPVTGVIYPAIVLGAALCGERVWSVTTRRSGAAVGWLIGAGVVAALAITTWRATDTARTKQGPAQETIALLSRYCDPHQFNWGAAGKLFNEVLPQNVRIATTSAGIIPFYCDRPCLDLHGLTDPEIARSPVDPNNRGRVGHEHWLQDYQRMRERGVDIYLSWVDPKPFAISLLNPPHPDSEMVSARLPNGSYTEFVILNHTTVDVAALRKDPRLVFYGDVKISGHGSLYALRDAFAGYTTVDTLDIEEDTSQREHAFEEVYPPDGPRLHNYHAKLMPYRPPLNEVTVYDVGRRIPYQATWRVHHVSARRDLVMIVRFDHTGGTRYEVTVNGHPVAGTLNVPGPPEGWDEAALTIPAALLVDGTNEFRLARSRETERDSELYYFWFLQPPDDEAG